MAAAAAEVDGDMTKAGAVDSGGARNGCECVRVNRSSFAKEESRQEAKSLVTASDTGEFRDEVSLQCISRFLYPLIDWCGTSHVVKLKRARSTTDHGLRQGPRAHTS